MVALKPGAPLGQDRNQSAVSDIFIRNIFRKAGYAQPIESSIKLMYRAVCNILPLHLQAELLVFLLEFPGIQTTRGTKFIAAAALYENDPWEINDVNSSRFSIKSA